MKACRDCGVRKPPEEFYKNRRKKQGRTAECKLCRTVYDKRRYAKNPEIWREKNRIRQLNWRDRVGRDRAFGLAPGTLLAMFNSQGKCCAICFSTTPQHSKGWHVDHDHKTNKVRGILCALCNVGLGHFRDSPTALTVAATYLRRHSE